MADRTIEEGVTSGLKDESTRTFLTERYLGRLYEVSSHLADQFGRNLLRMLVVSGAFVLLVEGAVPRIAVAGVTIENPTVVAKVLPAVIAVLFAQVVDYFMGLRLVERTAREIIRQRFPGMKEGRLDLIAALRDARSVEVLVRDSTRNPC